MQQQLRQRQHLPNCSSCLLTVLRWAQCLLKLLGLPLQSHSSHAGGLNYQRSWIVGLATFTQLL
jgi:hypothetical protein